MNPRHSIGRRQVLQLLATLSASAASGVLWGQETATPTALGVELDPTAVRDLAKAYADASSDTDGVRAMVERLRGQNLTERAVAEELRREMQADYDAGRTARLHGWIVSRTEARVLAAAAELLDAA